MRLLEPTPAPEAAPKTYGGDYEGIKDAAEELSEAREAGTVPQQSEPEEPVEAPIDRRWETSANQMAERSPCLRWGPTRVSLQKMRPGRFRRPPNGTFRRRAELRRALEEAGELPIPESPRADDVDQVRRENEILQRRAVEASQREAELAAAAGRASQAELAAVEHHLLAQLATDFPDYVTDLGVEKLKAQNPARAQAYFAARQGAELMFAGARAQVREKVSQTSPNMRTTPPLKPGRLLHRFWKLIRNIAGRQDSGFLTSISVARLWLCGSKARATRRSVPNSMTPRISPQSPSRVIWLWVGRKWWLRV